MAAGELELDLVGVEAAGEDFAVGGDDELGGAEGADVDEADDAGGGDRDDAVEGLEAEAVGLEGAAVGVAAAELDDVEGVAAEELEVADERVAAGEIDDALAEVPGQVLEESFSLRGRQASAACSATPARTWKWTMTAVPWAGTSRS